MAYFWILACVMVLSTSVEKRSRPVRPVEHPFGAPRSEARELSVKKLPFPLLRPITSPSALRDKSISTDMAFMFTMNEAHVYFHKPSNIVIFVLRLIMITNVKKTSLRARPFSSYSMFLMKE